MASSKGTKSLSGTGDSPISVSTSKAVTQYPYDGPAKYKDKDVTVKEVNTKRNFDDAKDEANYEMRSRGRNPEDFAGAADYEEYLAKNTQKGYGYDQQVHSEAGDLLRKKATSTGDTQRKKLVENYKTRGYAKGGPVKAKAKPKMYAKGGSVSSASKRADGCATKGKTRGRIF